MTDSKSHLRSKVKTGCRTCKIRKIKCDEGRPCCRKCTSTGRRCDGYGIWGGGHLSGSGTVLAASEKYYFDWFKHRAVKKLPGPFTLSFWQTLVFQASLNEPAVLHSILALSSVHKRDIVECHGASHDESVPDEQERFMLQHYTMAIRHLQPHFSAQSRASTRVALITCVVFVCLELLRGRFRIAEVHFRNGLKAAMGCRSLSIDDEWIIQAFSRLHVQISLFSFKCQHNTLVKRVVYPMFQSATEAWRQMEWVLSEALSRETGRGALQKDLDLWMETFKRSTFEEEMINCLLKEYHTLTTILVNAPDEFAYDSLEDHFRSILDQSTRMLEITLSGSRPVPLWGNHMDMSRSMIDMGWIPPLYFTAVKCRVHWIRDRAIQLIEYASHREGIWDSKIAALVARKVMEIETEGRIRLTDVVLPNSPGDGIKLCYERVEGSPGERTDHIMYNAL